VPWHGIPLQGGRPDAFAATADLLQS